MFRSLKFDTASKLSYLVVKLIIIIAFGIIEVLWKNDLKLQGLKLIVKYLAYYKLSMWINLISITWKFYWEYDLANWFKYQRRADKRRL